MHIVVIFLVIVLLFFVIHFYNKKREKERSDQIERFAAMNGFDFELEPAASFLDCFSGFQFFSKGHSRGCKNKLTKTKAEDTAEIFGYHYITGHGKHSTYHNYTVVCFQNQEFLFPSFELKPQHFFHNIGKIFGYQDIDFKDDKEFSDNFLLRGQDETLIRELFKPDLLDSLKKEPKICVEAIGQRVIFYRQVKRIKPDEIRQFYDETHVLYK